MRNKIVAFVFISLFIISVVWIVTQGTKSEILPIGSKLPKITYKSLNGYDTLKTDNQSKILVLFFSKECPHCKYELSTLNKNLDMLEGTTIYLFTTEESYLSSEDIKLNEVLLLSSKAIYGIVKEEGFKESFGSLLKPSLYFFSKDGILTEEIKGETKIERIIEELKKSDSPEYRISGNK